MEVAYGLSIDTKINKQ